MLRRGPETMPRDRVGTLLNAAALIAIGWSFVVLVTGGFRWQISTVLRISSTNSLRPLLIGLICGGAGWYAAPQRTAVLVRGIERAIMRWTPATVAATAVVVLWMGAGYGTHAASGSDSYGYVSQADLWLEGRLKTDQRWLDLGPPFDDFVFSPLGYRPSRTAHVIVPTYSPGLPLMMAAAKFAGGMEALYTVVPVLGALVITLTFVLGCLLFDNLVGMAACMLLAASPTFLSQLVWPMSDVPASAAWTLALIFGIVGRPFAAGLASTLAIVIRPNLAPLAVAVAVIACIDATPEGHGGWRRVLRSSVEFAAGTAPGVIAIAILNRYLYGSPLESGYGAASTIYHVRYLTANLARYPRWLIETQTPFILAAFVVLARPRLLSPGAFDVRRARVGLSAYLALLIVPYLFYLPFDGWWYLRFLLPGFSLLLVLAAGAVRRLRVSLTPELQFALFAITVLFVFEFELTTAQQQGVLNSRVSEQRYVVIAHDVRAITPPNAIYLSMQHSGSLRYYTHRITARYDSLPFDAVDTAVDILRARGFHPYFLLEQWEEGQFRERFKHNVDGRLDWNPVRRWNTPVPVALYDPPLRPPAPGPSEPWRK